jgi:hypothetical protein
MPTPIGNLPTRARGTNASASAPAQEASASAKSASPREGGNKPGADAPEHLRDSQPGRGQKTSWTDKLSAVGNLGMAAGSLAPLFQSHKGEGNKAGQPAQDNPPYDDMAEYYKNKVLVAVGPPPINW